MQGTERSAKTVTTHADSRNTISGDVERRESNNPAQIRYFQEKIRKRSESTMSVFFLLLLIIRMPQTTRTERRSEHGLHLGHLGLELCELLSHIGCAGDVHVWAIDDGRLQSRAYCVRDLAL